MNDRFNMSMIPPGLDTFTRAIDVEPDRSRAI
jgi:hypothetical protein